MKSLLYEGRQYRDAPDTKRKPARFQFLTGIDTPRLTRLLWQNRFCVERSYLSSVRYIAGVSVLATVFGLLDQILYGRKIATTVVVEPPVFILGHWRSGTSWLQKLLSLDPRHACPTFFQCVFPQGFLSGGRFLKPRTADQIPDRRPFDNMPVGVDEPFEEEFALLRTALVSPMLGFVFPRAWRRYDRHCEPEGLRPDERRRWKQNLLYFAKKLTLVSGRRLVFKSPAHAYRVKLILEVFPRARFILIVRDPYRVFASTRHLIRSLLEHNRLQAASGVEVEGVVFDRYLRMFRALARDLPQVPNGNFVMVRFEDLEARPLEQLEHIYRTLGIGDLGLATEPIQRYLADAKGYRKNDYQLTSAEKEGVYRRWQWTFERYGYRR